MRAMHEQQERLQSEHSQLAEIVANAPPPVVQVVQTPPAPIKVETPVAVAPLPDFSAMVPDYEKKAKGNQVKITKTSGDATKKLQFGSSDDDGNDSPLDEPGDDPDDDNDEGLKLVVKRRGRGAKELPSQVSFSGQDQASKKAEENRRIEQEQREQKRQELLKLRKQQEEEQAALALNANEEKVRQQQQIQEERQRQLELKEQQQREFEQKQFEIESKRRSEMQAQMLKQQTLEREQKEKQKVDRQAKLQKL